MLNSDRATMAERLRRAERDRVPIPPLVLDAPGMDAADAYQIQLDNIRRRTGHGARVVGHKVGLSAPAMQRMMGVDEPDYGHLLDTMRLDPEEPVAVNRYCYPRVEVEVGFLLGDDVPEDCDESGVLARTEALVPAIELIDSRIADWRISLADTIADNASSAGYALGTARIDPATVDVRSIDAELLRGSAPGGTQQVEKGRSDAVLGDPTIAVAWLARTVAGFGVRLRAGNVVLPGSCTRAVDVAAGDHFRAEFCADGVELGSVSLQFEER